jgi:predicted small secreted protein
MRRTLLITPAVLLAFSLAGCTGGVQANPAG